LLDSPNRLRHPSQRSNDDEATALAAQCDSCRRTEFRTWRLASHFVAYNVECVRWTDTGTAALLNQPVLLLRELSEQQKWSINIHRADSVLDDDDFYGYKYQSYLISSGTDIEGLTDQLMDLQIIPLWNNRARFLVVILEEVTEPHQELLRSIRDLFWVSSRVPDILVLIPTLIPDFHDHPKNVVRVSAIDGYSWFPYSSKAHCGDTVDIVHVHRFLWEKSLETFVFRAVSIPGQFHGCPMSLSSPLKSYSWSQDKTLMYSSYEMDILYMVCEILNVTVVHCPPASQDSDYYRNIVEALQGVAFGPSELAIVI
jgi:hypothetical protein